MKNILRSIKEYIVNRDRTSYPAKPTRPSEDMGSMLIQSLPELPPMHVAFNGGYNPIFLPRPGKLKGYMRYNSRRNKFNKTK